jgi:hypothetical protein
VHASGLAIIARNYFYFYPSFTPFPPPSVLLRLVLMSSSVLLLRPEKMY